MKQASLKQIALALVGIIVVSSLGIGILTPSNGRVSPGVEAFTTLLGLVIVLASLGLPVVMLIGLWRAMFGKGAQTKRAARHAEAEAALRPQVSSAPPFAFDAATAGNFVDAVIPLNRSWTLHQGLNKPNAVGRIEDWSTTCQYWKNRGADMCLAHEERARVTLWPEYRMEVTRALADALAAGFQPAGAELGPSVLKMGWHVNPEKSDNKCCHYPIEARVALVRSANVAPST